MIISHKHRFIFLKTKKTAGTSIEAALSFICGEDDILTPFREDQEQFRQGTPPQNFRIAHPLKPKRSLWHRLTRKEQYYHPTVGYYEHMSGQLVRTYVGEIIWRQYFKFAFERNPWDRQVSWYLYKTKSLANRPDFADFMTNPKRARVSNFEIYSEKGALTVDFLGRYEDLDNDLKRALSTVGVEIDLKIPVINSNVARNRDYRTYYTDATRDLVLEWYAPEISLLNYTF